MQCKMENEDGRSVIGAAREEIDCWLLTQNQLCATYKTGMLAQR